MGEGAYEEGEDERKKFCFDCSKRCLCNNKISLKLNSGVLSARFNSSLISCSLLSLIFRLLSLSAIKSAISIFSNSSARVICQKKMFVAFFSQKAKHNRINWLHKKKMENKIN